MIKYRINIFEALKKKGITSYKMRKDRIMGERQMTQIRRGEIVSTALLNKLCQMLECQPGDLLEYVSDDEDEDEENEGSE